MTITLPWIDAKLHAHAGGGLWSKIKATKAGRDHAKLICLDMINRKQVHPIHGRVLVTYSFFCPDNRRRDEANMLQSCKPAIDGIVSSGLIEGDHWQAMTIYGVFTTIDKANPRVEIRISAADCVGDLLAKRNETK